MEQIKLKNSDLTVSRLCMGGCPMGEYGWGIVEHKELIKAVNTAIDNGINFFDTADVYGLGQSEANFGEAFGKRRGDVIIATKFGVRIENQKTFYDNSPDWINTALEKSLKRLNTDYIDLYQVHYRDGVTPISAVVDTLEKLKQKGYIRYYGLSNIHKNDIKELKDYKGKFVSFQNEYSLACRKNEQEMLSFKELLSAVPLTWGSLGQGILTGKYDINSKFDYNDRRSRDTYVNFHGEKLKHNLCIVEELKKIAQSKGKSAAAVAIRFILDYLTDSVVIAGAKNSNQVVSNIEALGWNLSADEIKRLNEVSI